MSGTTARSYRPGSWFAIAGERALILLPPSEKARVAALWELVDDGAGFDVTLDALISGGLRDLPTFALVATEGGRTEVVIRGQAAATFTVDGDEVVVDGAEATTWAERSLTGVTQVSIEVEPDAGASATAYVVAGGVFRVSRIDQTPEAEPLVRSLHVVTDDEPGEVIVMPAAPVVHEPEPESEPEPEPETEPEAELEPEPEPEPETELETEAEPETEAVSPPRILPPMPPLPPKPPLPPTIPPPPSRPPASEGEEEANPAAAGRVRLTISNGETVDIDGVAVIGRAPEFKTYEYDDEPLLLAVPSAHMEISSAHLEVRPGEGEVLAVATDLGSTNGTVVVQPGSGPQDLTPGEPVELRSGTLIDIGDGITIQISRP